MARYTPAWTGHLRDELRRLVLWAARPTSLLLTLEDIESYREEGATAAGLTRPTDGMMVYTSTGATVAGAQGVYCYYAGVWNRLG